jgi:hypothetical protein
MTISRGSVLEFLHAKKRGNGTEFLDSIKRAQQGYLSREGAHGYAFQEIGPCGANLGAVSMFYRCYLPVTYLLLNCYSTVIGVAGYVAGPKMRAAFPCAQIAPSSVNPRQLVRLFFFKKTF